MINLIKDDLEKEITKLQQIKKNIRIDFVDCIEINNFEKDKNLDFLRPS